MVSVEFAAVATVFVSSIGREAISAVKADNVAFVNVTVPVVVYLGNRGLLLQC